MMFFQVQVNLKCQQHLGGVSFGAPYDTTKGGTIQVDGEKIIESGSNTNGSYIKWADGTMICYMNKSYANVNVDNVWGSMYESGLINLGNFPATFVGIPAVTASVTRRRLYCIS